MKNWGMRRFYHSSFFILHLFWLFQIVAAINDAGVEEGGWSWQTATIGSAGLLTRSSFARPGAW